MVSKMSLQVTQVKTSQTTVNWEIHHPVDREKRRTCNEAFVYPEDTSGTTNTPNSSKSAAFNIKVFAIERPPELNGDVTWGDKSTVSRDI